MHLAGVEAGVRSYKLFGKSDFTGYLWVEDVLSWAPRDATFQTPFSLAPDWCHARVQCLRPCAEFPACAGLATSRDMLEANSRWNLFRAKFSVQNCLVTICCCHITLVLVEVVQLHGDDVLPTNFNVSIFVMVLQLRIGFMGTTALVALK